MTSTSFNIGINQLDRASSKVLKPPGGGTSDIFGGTEVEPVKASIPRKKNAQASSIVLDDSAPTAPAPVQNGQAPRTDVPLTNGNSEPITNGKTAPAAAPAPSEPKATRPRVPPGGFSSGLW